MKFWEAMKALEDGKKVRNSDWPDPFFISNEGYFGLATVFESTLTSASCEWELYEGAVKRSSAALELAKDSYKQICEAIDGLKKAGIDCEYPRGLKLNGKYFDDVLLKEPATYALHLRCNKCGLTDFVLKKDAKDWNCSSCPLRTYTFMEVVKGLKEGKRFKRKGNFRTIFMKTEENEHLIRTAASDKFDEDFWVMTLEDFEATDWIEVRELLVRL